MDLGLPVVFGAGVATLLTPCILPLLPLWLGMLVGTGLDGAREGGGRMRLVTSTLAFVLGFALVFTILGLGASTLGAALQQHRAALLGVGGVLIAAFGLKFLGVLKIPWLDRDARLPALRTGHRLLDALLFGVVFALGWTPCVGPILGSVLTFTASRSAEPLTGMLYLGTYSLGVGLPLVVLSLFLDRLLPLLERFKKRLPVMEKATGGVLVAMGLVLVATGGLALRPEGAPGVLHADDGREVRASEGSGDGKPRIVEFYEEDCPTCREVEPLVEELREDCQGRHIDIVQVDISDGRNRGLARVWDVRAVPTFVLLDEEGTEVRRVIGGVELPDLRQAAATLIMETCAGERGLVPGQEIDGSGGCPGDRTIDPATPDNPFVAEQPSCEG